MTLSPWRPTVVSLNLDSRRFDSIIGTFFIKCICSADLLIPNYLCFSLAKKLLAHGGCICTYLHMQLDVNWVPINTCGANWDVFLFRFFTQEILKETPTFLWTKPQPDLEYSGSTAPWKHQWTLQSHKGTHSDLKMFKRHLCCQPKLLRSQTSTSVWPAALQRGFSDPVRA